MRKRAKLTIAIFLAASVNVSYGGENCLPPDAGMNDPMKIFECFQGMLNAGKNSVTASGSHTPAWEPEIGK